MIKKAVFVIFMLFSSISAVYAANSKNITLNIQGSGPAAAVEGFKYALKIEANAAGYQVTENVAASKYYIKFTVVFDQTEQKQKFTVSLVKTADSSEIVSMEYFFADEEEMLLYSQLVFFLLMANLPEDETTAAAVVENDDWRNKWLYLRGSFDFSIAMFALKPDGLIGGGAIFAGTEDNPTGVALIDNKVILMPGISLGAEIQFLDFMSLEIGAGISMEEIVLNEYLFNLLFSAELKFPLKFFRNFVIEPYGAVFYPMRFPKEKGNEVFDSFPMLAYGGGLQISVKAGKNSAAFIDVSYLYFGDTGMYNQFNKYYPNLGYYPNPEVIHYNYSTLSFRIGYKHGFIDRKKK